MRAINHALTGAVIGLTIAPAIALPLALISHYVLDAIPHFGHSKFGPKSKVFMYSLVIDALLCVALVAGLYFTAGQSWYWAAICAFIAASPDLMWAPNYYRQLKQHAPQRHLSPFVRFHKYIQWYERPKGVWVEAIWGLAMVFWIVQIIQE